MLGLLNVGLRATALLGRFALLIVIAHYLTPSEVGLYALFSAASLWGVYLQGLEFHLFNVREIVAADDVTRARRTRDAFALYALIFVLATLVWTSLFGANLLPWSVFGWFLATLVLEHVTQEAYRLLNAFGRPLAGSFVVFLRSGAWMYLVAIAFVIDPSLRSLEVVFGAWTLGAGAAAGVALAFLRGLPWRDLPAVDWAWLRRGMRICLPLLAGSLALRGISVFERWLVGYTHGEVSLGVFGFYAAIAGALPVLADSGVGAVLYPRMMRAWQQQDRVAYRRYMRQLLLAFVAFTCVAVPAALVAIYIALEYIAQPAYQAEQIVFHVLLASAAVSCVAAVPQYALWAQNRDRPMIAISIVGLGVTLAADVVLVPRYAAVGAAVGQLLGASVMLVMRVFAARRGGT